MAVTTQGVVQHRRGTATQLTTANPTLLAGEIGIETDTYEFKIGDGVTAWNSLAYYTANFTFPVGASYIQLPGGAAPGSFLTGTWTAQFETEGVFFRTPGGNASAFESGIQNHQLQGHWHEVYGSATGAAGAGITVTRPNVSNTVADSVFNGARNPITDGVNGVPNTGVETRPINVTVRVWLRTA